MSSEIATTNPQSLTVKGFFGQKNVKEKFEEMLGKRATSFMTSVLQICSSSKQLSTADPLSVYQAACMAATLDLPINNNLGFAYIIPFKEGDIYKAQFQLGYKGFIQLAQRSGQFKSLGSCPIYEGQIIEENPLTGFVFDFTKKKSEKVLGYAANFTLLSGFSKTLYMSMDEINNHGKKYSQTFKKNFGLWKDDFNAMATKTVLKLLLSKYAPLSVDTQLQKAVLADQSVIKNVDTMDVDYVDNDNEEMGETDQKSESEQKSDNISNDVAGKLWAK